jgi:class 3 adenylate cyclase/predicted ATPase
MQSIAEWLEELGLGAYTQRFDENGIDFSVLGHLSDQDLKDLGVLLGHRRKLQAAIAGLPGTSPAPPKRAAAPITKPYDAAERRQLTVMFCDLVGSTPLSARLDPEDLRGIIGAYHGRCTELIERNDGFVAKYMGDGVLAYFGYPQAHEHDAERAVRAGLDLVEAVPKLPNEADTPLQVRVGIATGLVVVGDLIGAGAAREQAVVGETPNLAARLQALAKPGAVVIAEGTRKLLGNLFELNDLGSLELRGLVAPVRAFTVIRPSSIESRFEALHASELTTLVGREEETDLLLRRWQRAKRGEGQLVLLCGEPGIGKSRVVIALLDRIASEPHTRLRYFCSPHHSESALYPIIQRMERAAGFEIGDDVQAKLNKLNALLQQTSTPVEDGTIFADLLSLAGAGPDPELNLTPQERRGRTIDAMTRRLEALACRQPVLLIFEDVHWIDPTSLDVLNRMVHRIPGWPVLLVVSFRPEFQPPWVGEPHVTLLTLNRLGPDDSRRLLEQIDANKELPGGAVDEIIARTDGVPLFVEELTKAVVEAGTTQERRDQIAVIPRLRLAVPTTLHASLMARLDRLGSGKEVAQIGSAIGREFSYELLATVSRCSPDQLEGALERLVDAGLLFREGVRPHATFLFKHALVQDAAYGTLLRSQRERLHARIAAALEGHFPEIVTAQPALLAHHCTEAGLMEAAVDYWLKAGQGAAARAAGIEAESQLRRALSLLADLPDSAGRQHRELEIQIALALVLMVTQAFAGPVVTETFARARQLCEQLDKPSQLAVVLSSQCGYHLLRGELVLACQESKQLLDLGQFQNDPEVILQGCTMSAYARFQFGDFAEALTYAEKALALCDPMHTPNWGAIDSQLMPLTFLFRSLVYLGYLQKARQRRDEALVRARQCGRPHTLASILGITLLCEAHAHSDPTNLLQDAEELAALCAKHDFGFWGAYASLVRGGSMSALGHAEAALPFLMEAVSIYRATGTRLNLPSFLIMLAETLGKAGRQNEGLEQLDEAARQIEETCESRVEAELHRVRGELLVRVGDPVAGMASFYQAITVARRQNARLWELLAAASLARLWRDQGRRREAHDLLAPVYGWFTEGFDTPVLRDAKELLDQLA